MRVSQNQLYNLLTTHLQDSFSSLAQLQEQVSSGKRIQVPSDDPTGSSLALALHVRHAQIDGYASTATSARTRVDEASSIVQQASDVLGSARELAIQGMSTALGANARAILATQVYQLREQMMQLANTQYDGEYIFGGSNTTQSPVKQTGVGDSAKVTWQGDDHPRMVTVGPGDDIDTGVPGKSLFARFSPTGTTYGGTSGIKAGTSGDQGSGFANLIVRHDSTSGTPGAGVTFANAGANDTFLGDRTLEIDSNGPKVRLGGGTWVNFTSTAGAYPTDVAVQDDHGATIHLDLSAWTGAASTSTVHGSGSLSLDGTNFTAMNGTETNLQLKDPSTGTIIHVDTTAAVRSGQDLVTFGGTTNVFDMLAGMAADLRNTTLTNDEISKRLGARLGELDAQHDSVLVGLGSLGARSARIADVQDRLNTRTVDVESRLANVEDVDITKAVLDLTRTQQTLQLAESTGAKIIQTTLLDYLR
jgi:flagellar hook-associated protein 3 FlgL